MKLTGAVNHPALSYRMLSKGNILKQAKNSVGSGFYLPRSFHVTREVVLSAVITFTLLRFSRQSKELSKKQEFVNMGVATHLDTASQHISWRQELIFGPFKSYWVIAIYEQLKFIYTSRVNRVLILKAR
jgi:hypothetical protein